MQIKEVNEVYAVSLEVIEICKAVFVICNYRTSDDAYRSWHGLITANNFTAYY